MYSMQKSYSDNKQLSLGNIFNFNKSNMSRNSSLSNYSSAASSTNYNDTDSSFNYDSEDMEANQLVGQALHYCEATRGGKKKQFANAEERYQFR